MKKAVDISVGLGGLSAAITMQSKGMDVANFDENPHAGGKVRSVDTEGFHFDFGTNTWKKGCLLKVEAALFDGF